MKLPVRIAMPVFILTGVAVLLLALVSGSVVTGLDELLAFFSGNASPVQTLLIGELRWPRAATAFAAGGLLAMAGALMQVLLRNPLADPYILGVAGGASVAALLTMLAGLTGIWIGGGAFVGAMASMLLVFGLAHGRGSWTVTRLLLTGVVIAFAWGALISFILAVSPQTQLRGMLFWLMGDLGYARYAWWPLLTLLIGIVLCLPVMRQLNVLTRGMHQAALLGVNTSALQRRIYLLASLFTAVAVTLAGGVGFIGLVVPHMLRLLIGSDHRWLLPSSALLGGSLLVLADTAARTVLAPQQLPVGIMTAAIGVPLFLYLLYQGQRQ
jgi:iron complex transport system permease protein